MPFDAGRLNVNSAGTAETLASDLSATATVTASSRIKSITVVAPEGNTGNVFFGGATVSSTYGITLTPGDSFSKVFEGTVQFDTLYGDAATSADDIDWAVEFLL